jgi:hypothetical protein
MEGVQIFLAVMACSSDLLICDDLSDPRGFRDMAACQVARAEVLDHSNTRNSARSQIFARCRYVLVDATRAADSPMTVGHANGLAAW